MTLINWLAETIILPGSDLVLKEDVSIKLRFLLKSQYWSHSEIRAYQNKKLRELVIHAYKSVPYYTELFDKLQMTPDDIRTVDDLEKLPILNKAEIKRHGIEKFTSTAIPLKSLIKTSSSGSTGEPLFYYTTKDAYCMNIATNLRGWYWMGFRLGDKFMKLSQNPRSNPIKIIQDKISRNMYMSTNPLIESNFHHILKSIEKYQPKVLRCYPDPLLLLARCKQGNSEFKYKPFAIATTGNTLHPETRNEIEAAFGCKIFDAYSCEGNSNVSECSTHDCYHSSEEYGITELLDESGKPIKNGIGRLISTDLFNFAHPFIRYDTQDLAEVNSKPCTCGRKLLRINRIIGRDNDIITTVNGRNFIVHNFTVFFQTDGPELNQSIDQFQVVKRDSGHIHFRLVVNSNYSLNVEKYIKAFWKDQFSEEPYIEIVKEIPLTSSGKRCFIINEE